MSGILGIVGTGLIGASIGLRARANGETVIGCDARSEAVAEAIAAGAVDRAVSFEELLETSGTIVVAAHLEGTLETLARFRSLSHRAELIVDVASVKAPVAKAARGIDAFVATHPMAGSERSGASAARADLFEGRTWAYVPSSSDALDARARAFIESMGAVPFACDASDHDRAVALTSHLPQLMASAYGRLFEDDGGVDALCGPAARELRRLASMRFEMWGEILAANAGNVEPFLRAQASRLNRIADALALGDRETLARAFR